jgi:hypothetical protein
MSIIFTNHNHHIDIKILAKSTISRLEMFWSNYNIYKDIKILFETNNIESAVEYMLKNMKNNIDISILGDKYSLAVSDEGVFNYEENKIANEWERILIETHSNYKDLI